MIVTCIVAGFFTAFGWWGANHFVIEPYLEKPATTKAISNIEKKLPKEVKEDTNE